MNNVLTRTKAVYSGLKVCLGNLVHRAPSVQK